MTPPPRIFGDPPPIGVGDTQFSCGQDIPRGLGGVILGGHPPFFVPHGLGGLCVGGTMGMGCPPQILGAPPNPGYPKSWVCVSPRSWVLPPHPGYPQILDDPP